MARTGLLHKQDFLIHVQCSVDLMWQFVLFSKISIVLPLSQLATVFFLTRGQFWPSGIVVACVCVCVSVCVSVGAITRDPFNLGSPNLDERCRRLWSKFLLNLGQLILTFNAKFNLKVRIYPHFELIRTITHYSFKIRSQNLDHRCIIAWLNSLLLWVAIDLDLQGQIWLQSRIFWSHHYWKYITTI